MADDNPTLPLDEASGAPAPENVAPTPVGGSAPEKPKRTRKPRVKKAETPSEGEAPVEHAGSEAPAEAAPEKPKRARKPRAKKAEDGAQEGEAATPEAEAPVEPAPEKPKRARRTRKKSGPDEEKPQSETGVEASAAPSESNGEDQKPEKPQGDGSKADERPRDEKPRDERPKNEERPDPQRRDRKQGGGQNGGGQNASGQGGRNNRNKNNRNDRGSRHKKQPAAPSLTREELEGMKVAELRAKAAEVGVAPQGLRKAELVDAVYDAAARAEGFRPVAGILEIANDNFGFIRTDAYMQGEDDAFVQQNMIRQWGLRPGDYVEGTVRPAAPGNKFPPLAHITAVNGKAPEEAKGRPRFRDLTPIYPNERLKMENGQTSITGRVIDLVAPIGKGQRGLIVSPPKAGKTTVLKHICQSIAHNNPEVHLICLLVDERPEEVTDMQRSIKGDVVASTFDMPADNHTKVAELVIERAKRLVEQGEDVVVVLDSITRLARAYNLAAPASGRILSGGVDSAALYPPKRFLGAARNIENGGSLTIIASALVDTGSKMDEVIFEEFKGTGNMELKLDRELADKRIFPAVDPVASGTRNEDLLMSPQMAPFVWGLRRVLANMNNAERAEASLVKGLKQTATNEEFLIRSAKKAAKTDYMD
ncbi:transcription termination factor Rho [Olsenella sp. YH-ols2217]|uniref:Transcription termination factor Rho n=1 Tax=Kribbibacterium absianum TaxID=3044210 RepID=A0ABT6ZLZ4_9ACTN|nr:MULTISPECIES: transcription termination factor Rho [unclassified Olsenella]MDJ1122052.1 transcription termination factor Rho [Olsenella sp. YH-ols2216]MDJ1130060.1 transcription termination factor Rho [Olsenella sp. YH-ols2217]